MFERLKQRLTQMVFTRSGPSTRWLFLTPGQRAYWRKVGDGSSSSVVMAPLLWITRNFPEAPPALWEKTGDSGEEERVTGKGDHGGDHLLLELLEHPNQYYSGSLLWMATLLDWHLSGDGYWIKLRDRGGRPVELWWAPSGLMHPVGDEKTFISHYVYRPGAEDIEIPSEDVVHFRYGMDPENPRKGRSPLSSLLQEVFTDGEASDFVAALLRNMGVPGLVISPKNADIAPSQGDVQATKDKLKEDHTGDRRGEPLVMSGPTDVEQFGFSPQQMNLRDIRRIPEERVTAVLGIPAIVCGLGAGLDRSTYANYAEAREAAYQDNIIPSQRLLASDIQSQLLPDFQPDDFWSYRFGFDHSGVRVLQEDRNDLAARLDVGIRGGWIRVAEGRRALDLDVDESDEIYLRPLNLIEVTAGEAGQAPVAPESLSPGSRPALPAPSEEEPPTSQRKQRKRTRPTRLQSRLVQALSRDKIVLSNMLSKELEKELLAFGDACAETYQHMTASQSGRNGHGEQKILEAETLARMVVTTLWASFDDSLKRMLERNTLRVLDQTLDTLGTIANLTSGVQDPVQRSILEAGGKRRGLIDMEQSARNVILNAINEGNQLGEGPVAIARTIREDVPAGRFTSAGPSYRSQLISRTETNWAQNTSAIAAYREADEVQSCVAMDGGDDPECAERNGQEFSFDDAEAELEKEHPNGTLTFAPVVQTREEVPA